MYLANKSHKPFFNSIRFKMIFIFMIFTIPLNAWLIINNNYAMQVVRNQVSQSNKNLVSLYMVLIDRTLEEADKYLYSMITLNTDLLNMELSQNNNNQQYYSAKIRLFNTMSKDINNYKSIDIFFAYSGTNEDLLITQNLSASYYEMEKIVDDIKRIFTDKQFFDNYDYDRWFIRQIDGNYFMCHIVKTGNVYIGAWANAENLMVPLNLVDLGQKGKAILITGSYDPMNNADFISENKINLAYEQNSYNLTGYDEKFLVVGEKSNRGNFSLTAVIPDSVILEKLPYLQKAVSLVSFSSVFIIVFVYLIFLRKVILSPLGRIITGMKNISKGDLEARITLHRTSSEFEFMNLTFNSMASQIQELKIEVYEEKINKQKAELKHLQLQINPHFFLNSLHVIYQLAQVKDFNLIQEMSICLIEYFRFMFRSNLTFVILEEEVKHTRNYLKIQEMRFPDHLTYNISVLDYLMKYMIPPLLIQTFVENSIKHGMTLDDPIHICIDVGLGGTLANPMIKISVYDTGKGFPEDILQQLQLEIGTVNELGEHIGIWNVQQRLRLLYNEQAEITFSNRPDGGASVEIGVPLKIKY